MVLFQVDQIINHHQIIISQIINKHTPLIKLRIKDRFNYWFSRDLAVLIHQKNTLWWKARSSQSTADWLAFRQCRNKWTYGDMVITDKSHMASLFNQHLVNSAHVFFAKPSTAAPSLSPTTSSSGTFSFRPITTSEVLENLIKLDSNNSAGSDRLDPMFLKAAAPVIAVPISAFIHVSGTIHLSFRLEIRPCLPPLQRGL